jgi:hypothetical protein
LADRKKKLLEDQLKLEEEIAKAKADGLSISSAENA